MKVGHRLGGAAILVAVIIGLAQVAVALIPWIATCACCRLRREGATA